MLVVTTFLPSVLMNCLLLFFHSFEAEIALLTQFPALNEEKTIIFYKKQTSPILNYWID